MECCFHLVLSHLIFFLLMNFWFILQPGTLVPYPCAIVLCGIPFWCVLHVMEYFRVLHDMEYFRDLHDMEYYRDLHDIPGAYYISLKFNYLAA